MKIGTVELLNVETQRCAVRVDNSEYSILEMFDEIGLSLGDRISGALEDLGNTVTVRNHTTGMIGEAWIDDISQDRQTAINSLRLS